MSVGNEERRRERRHAARGVVQILIGEPVPVAITGYLVDLSANGFRVRHSSAELATGQVVQFAHALARGQAKVVWTRILDEGRESGLAVLKLPANGPQ